MIWWNTFSAGVSKFLIFPHCEVVVTVSSFSLSLFQTCCLRDAFQTPIWLQHERFHRYDLDSSDNIWNVVTWLSVCEPCSLISFEPYFGFYFPTLYLTKKCTNNFIIRSHWFEKIWWLFLGVLIIFLNWESPPQHFSNDIWFHQCTLYYNLLSYW